MGSSFRRGLVGVSEPFGGCCSDPWLKAKVYSAGHLVEAKYMLLEASRHSLIGVFSVVLMPHSTFG